MFRREASIMAGVKEVGAYDLTQRVSFYFRSE